MGNPILSIQDLTVEFSTRRGVLRAVDQVSFELAEGETLGIVGESGCGKSMTSLALMGLLPTNSTVTASRMGFSGRSLLAMPESERRHLRGGEMTMIFQDPMASLNPSFTVGFQIEETLLEHADRAGGKGVGSRALRTRAIDLLGEVGIPAPETRMNSFPHQLSGGMCQRVMIAMAIACQPRLLIADEPTTALDVTIQAQILKLLKDLQKRSGTALILITHDLGVVSQVTDRVQVMYAGQIVERGLTSQVISDPQHPYTRALLDCLPGEATHRARLKTISGLVPDLVHPPRGCLFHPRCPEVFEQCSVKAPTEIMRSPGSGSRCLK